MKAFTTIAALLGATYANPIQHIQYGSTGLRNINQPSSNNLKKDMHNMAYQHVTQITTPINIVAEMHQPVTNPNQYLLKDNFGNYAFGYSTQNSEMSEEGNSQSKKGHFANIMADGKLRRVDYVADNQGFHILRDTADNTSRYIKREAEAEPSVEPDLIRNRMTSYMKSSSLMDDGSDVYRMPNNMISSNKRLRNNHMTSMYKTSDMVNHGMSKMVGQEMSTNMKGRKMSTNVMALDMRPMNNHMSSVYRMFNHGMPSNMMGRDMSTNVMGHDMTSNKLGNGLTTDMISPNLGMNMMDQTMYTNMMGEGKMTSNTTPFFKLGQGMLSTMMERNMMGKGMYSNAMDNKMSSNIMMSRNMNQMSPLNRMSQRMEIETIPSQSLNRFF